MKATNNTGNKNNVKDIAIIMITALLIATMVAVVAYLAEDNVPMSMYTETHSSKQAKAIMTNAGIK